MKYWFLALRVLDASEYEFLSLKPYLCNTIQILRKTILKNIKRSRNLQYLIKIVILYY